MKTNLWISKDGKSICERIRFKTIVEKHFHQTKNTFYSDNGGEYIVLAFQGISHPTSLPHTPKHNGYIERHHLRVVETSPTLLSHAYSPLTYWSHAFAMAVYLINHSLIPTQTHFSLRKDFWVSSYLFKA